MAIGYAIPGPTTVVVDREYQDGVKLIFGTGGDVEYFFDGTDMFTRLAEVSAATGWMIGLAASPPSPDGVAVHIWKGNSGSITANSLSALVLESDLNVFLQFMTPNGKNQRILFNSTTSSRAGYLDYTLAATPSFNFHIAASTRLSYSAGAFAFQEATVISTTVGNLTFSPAAEVDMDAHAVVGVTNLRGTAGANLNIRANKFLSEGTARSLHLQTIDTSGNAAVDVAYAVPTATGTTPFWAQRADVTTPLTGTLDASFLTFKWDPADDSVKVYVNDGGTIRSVSIGTVT